MTQVSIIGYGNVGSQLHRAFEAAGIRVSHILRRNLSEGENGIFTDRLEDLPKNQLAIVAIPDDHISELIDRVTDEMPIAYTSGSIQLKDVRKNRKVGVFYPLQTFTKDNEVEFNKVPILIEAAEDSFRGQLMKLGNRISSRVKEMSSEDRKRLHLAAVWVNNFTNHMNTIAKDIMSEYELDYSLLLPLLQETSRKIAVNGPKDSQTGPAKRGDQGVIEEHLRMLDNEKAALYKLITDHIQKNG